VWDVMDGDAQDRLRSRIGLIDWRRMLFEFPPLPLPNVAFRNRGDLTFEDASKRWHFDIGDDISHGMALADLDGDGDLDVVINRLDRPAAVLRNDATRPRIAVRLRGAAPNTAGFGSRITVRGGAVPLQEREMVCGGLYLSSSDASLTFATGSATHVRIIVDWRDGRRTVIDSATPNREYEIIEGQSSVNPDHPPRIPQALFEDVSAELGGHAHVDPYFDDYARQPLLPNSFAQLGPGVAWEDVDGDGREDLFVGAGRTGSLAYFHNVGGRLRRAATRFPPAAGDLTTVLGWPDGHGGRQILAGVAAYEATTGRQARETPSVIGYSPSTGVMTPLVGGDTASVGPLALADYDGDGDLDLFVGARVYPAGYPLSPSSRMYRNDGGRLTLDSVNTPLFSKLGMVSAAVFSDIDGDGDPDLLVAVEWGAIRVFRNDGGRFTPVGYPGLSEWYGRWNGLATGDLDGDGRPDIVATGWGRNTDYHPTPNDPLLLYVGFFAGGGRPDFLLAQNDPRVHGVAPLTPFDRLSDARPLPAEAQLAPAFYAGIADFDGDGKEDLFLTQNFFATDLATARYDAGRGLLLLGDGRGGFEPVSGQRSGILVYGEQRGAAYADFDGDGRLDLAVGENGAPTRLFHNIGATPGLRVRIVGPPANPSGIGTQLRLRFGNEAGPLREVQAGSGYWSQNGAVQVLGGADRATALWVRWPGGREEVVPHRAGQREITIHP
ncbi:MAG: hypothetical protein DMD54_14745, partial [Gemmatimonadetes bacterium]